MLAKLHEHWTKVGLLRTHIFAIYTWIDVNTGLISEFLYPSTVELSSRDHIYKRHDGKISVVIFPIYNQQDSSDGRAGFCWNFIFLICLFQHCLYYLFALTCVTVLAKCYKQVLFKKITLKPHLYYEKPPSVRRVF